MSLIQPFDDTHYMKEALREAQRAMSEEEVPIGAVVVANGRIIARGHNMVEKLHDATAHAEMIAITAASEQLHSKYLKDCTVYITVEPCPMCAAALKWAQVARVVYGAPEEKWGYRHISEELLHPKTAVTAGILADDCRALMQTFFRSKRED